LSKRVERSGYAHNNRLVRVSRVNPAPNPGHHGFSHVSKSSKGVIVGCYTLDTTVGPRLQSPVYGFDDNKRM